MPKKIIQRYEKEICSNCCKTNCKKGIVVSIETIDTEIGIKNITSAKCVDYKKKNKRWVKD